MGRANVCGTNAFSPCENIYNAVMGERFSLSIDMRDEPEVLKIIDEAIGDDVRKELLLRCYGLDGRVRVPQVEAAKALGVDQGTASRMIRDSIKTLQRPTYRKRLQTLAIDKEAAYQAVRDYKSLETRVAELTESEMIRTANMDKTQKQINGYRDAVKSRDEVIAKLQEQKFKDEYELATLHKRLTDAEAQRNEAWRKLAQANDELVILRREREMVTNFCQQIGGYAEKVSNASKKVLERHLDELFDDGIMNALARAKITSLEELCNMSEHNLRKSGLGKKYVSSIKHKLAELGLGLRAA